jgi:hypothetical protein
MTRDARLSALHRGGFGLPGPRFRLLRRPPSYNGGQLPSGSVQRAPRTQVVVPGGRGPGPPGANGYEPPPQDATPRSAFRIVSGDAPHERGWESYSMASICSQEINTSRSRCAILRAFTAKTRGQLRFVCSDFFHKLRRGGLGNFVRLRRPNFVITRPLAELLPTPVQKSSCHCDEQPFE